MKLFVSNLPREVSRIELLRYFERYGPVTSIYLPDNGPAANDRAFIQMPAEAAIEAVQALDGAMWGGRLVHVAIARPKGKR